MIMSPVEQTQAQLARLIEGGENPADAVRELDRILREQGRELPADLNHYLAKRSYHKALAFCRGDLAPRH